MSISQITRNPVAIPKTAVETNTLEGRQRL
jgi:hypothetical protein